MDAEAAEELRSTLAAAASERGMELDDSGLDALCATFQQLTGEALQRAVRHLQPPPLLHDLTGAYPPFFSCLLPPAPLTSVHPPNRFVQKAQHRG